MINDKIAEIVSILDKLEDTEHSRRELLMDALWSLRLASVYINDNNLLTVTEKDAGNYHDKLLERADKHLAAFGQVGPGRVRDTLLQSYQVVGALLGEDGFNDGVTVKMLDNISGSSEFHIINNKRVKHHKDVLPYNKICGGAELSDDSSPCVNVCRLDKDKKCIGCGRTVDEISNWGSFNTERKIAIKNRIKTSD